MNGLDLTSLECKGRKPAALVAKHSAFAPQLDSIRSKYATKDAEAALWLGSLPAAAVGTAS